MTSDTSPENPQEELARLRERLAFYEGFDDLIQSQVTRSSELLKAALDTKEAAEKHSEENRLQIRAEQEIDLERYRALFSRLLDEITVLQTQAEHLAVILADAVDEIEAKVPVGGALPNLPDLIPEPFADADRVPDVVETPPAQLEPPAPAPVKEKAWAAFVPKPEPVPVQRQETLAAVEPETETIINARQESHDPTEPVTVLVHGIPGAAVAISMKRHLEQQPGIIGVEPRELTAGLLRLQVLTETPVSLGDFAGWSRAADLTSIRSTDRLLELTLR